jgi:hypothetical protein
METLEGLLISIFWFVLRFGIPILVTAALMMILARMDSRWREQAAEIRAKAVEDGIVPVVKCWLFNGCPDDKLVDCPAYQNQGKPCWQHFRTKDGCLKQECLSCRVFRGAPVPVVGD